MGNENEIMENEEMTQINELEEISEEDLNIWKKSEQDLENMSMKDLQHDIRIKANQLAKECKIAGIPFFLSYYNKDRAVGKRYQYAAMFPEELENGVAESEYGKFKKFLQVVIGFNRTDYEPQLSKRVMGNPEVPEEQ